MHLPVPKAGIVGLSALFALVAAMAVFIYTSGANEAEAATYNPTSAAKFCNDLSASFPQTKPFTDADLAGGGGACVEGAIPVSTARNYTVNFTVGGTHSNFGSSVVTNVPGTTNSVPDGQKVGGLKSDVVLGLLNGACITNLVAEFILYSAPVSGAAITPAPEGTTNRWDSITTDADADEIGDPTSDAIASNLTIYEDLFTPAGGSTITPLARYTGVSRVPPGGDWQLLSFFQFSAGALDGFMTGDDEPHIFGRTSHAPTTGTLSVSILNDPTAVQISESAISDFCTPLFVQTMLLGSTPGGHTRYTTPADAGTYGISNFSYGQRDADNDGIENALDTCPFHTNNGDRVGTTGHNGNGIDSACNGGAPNVTDVDGDGFSNRQDNCPLDANGGAAQVDSEVGGAYITVAPDGGPKGDSIGDACDPNLGNSVTEGAFAQSYNLVVKCIGGTDADADGYCTAQDLDDSSACIGLPLPQTSGTPYVCSGGGIGGFALNQGMDSEYKDGSGTQGDHGDKAGGNREVYWGSSATSKCGGAAHWPYDLAGGNSINIADVAALKTPFGQPVTVGGPAFPRFDLAPSKTINIADVAALKPVFGLSCTP